MAEFVKVGKTGDLAPGNGMRVPGRRNSFILFFVRTALNPIRHVDPVGLA